MPSLSNGKSEFALAKLSLVLGPYFWCSTILRSLKNSLRYTVQGHETLT